MTSPAPPAGWYADPHGLPALRWWDGQEWTSHIQPGATATPPVIPAAAPSGTPVPGAHTIGPQSAGSGPAPSGLGGGLDLTGWGQGELRAPSITAPSVAAQQAFAPPSGYPMQPVDAVSAQLGFVTPATSQGPPPAAGEHAISPKNRAVVVGAISLLINPLLLCSVFAIVLGVRGLPASRPTATLAIALGATGVLTHIGLVLLLIHLL
ncbi:hypothetical protein FB565_006615 [Actinoplanes lutulentus]|uniref:Uncharacterized protein DUF2510 n=1 Tax=Actinoplanes lutulentus TaxID=1287878 RepID=A0A327ZI46_9ACTN|nr:DUF2510 domain-containing protein [Actinoplanes lutulentus]MBB2946847.1 hypothetical protein [Actinoplanes lutulentus]RAK35741.1 uncharacterized protein DUF2510 [Actinoplanes lutulentus]